MDIDFDKFSYSKGILFQTSGWFSANNICNSQVVICDENEILIGGCYVISNCELYFPKGPLISKNCSYLNFVAFIQKVVEVAHTKSCISIRFELSEFEQFNVKLVEFFKKYGATKSNNYNFMNYNYIIDLENLNIEDYMKKLPHKTRYNINYAIRNDVKVIYSNSKAAVNKFYKILEVTSARSQFKIKPKYVLENLIDMFKENIKIYFAYRDGQILSSAMYIEVGEIAYFLYGGSSNLDRNKKASYLLQYEMIKGAIANGCKIYTLGGVGKVINAHDVMLDSLIEYKRKFASKLISIKECYELKL